MVHRQATIHQMIQVGQMTTQMPVITTTTTTMTMAEVTLREVHHTQAMAEDLKEEDQLHRRRKACWTGLVLQRALISRAT